METGIIKKFQIPQLNAFDFQIKYNETNRKTHFHEIEIHSHDKFEIYVNLSGDVSFLVNNNLYDLSRGDVIVARPGEYHHCIYRSDAQHKLFWILFDSNKNNGILDFLKNDFHHNYFSPRGELREELLELCYKFLEPQPTEEEKIYSFFRIFAILKMAQQSQESNIPHELQKMIDYIDEHIYEAITVKSIAEALYISQSTLERKFKETLDMTPFEYIRNKKLILSANMLKEGKTVLDSAISVGYNDISYFIELFKQHYKITPYQFKKKHRQ